jgi:hypothetical protein
VWRRIYADCTQAWRRGGIAVAAAAAAAAPQAPLWTVGVGIARLRYGVKLRPLRSPAPTLRSSRSRLRWREMEEMEMEIRVGGPSSPQGSKDCGQPPGSTATAVRRLSPTTMSVSSTPQASPSSTAVPMVPCALPGRWVATPCPLVMAERCGSTSTTRRPSPLWTPCWPMPRKARCRSWHGSATLPRCS